MCLFLPDRRSVSVRSGRQGVCVHVYVHFSICLNFVCIHVVTIIRCTLYMNICMYRLLTANILFLQNQEETDVKEKATTIPSE